jgi:hypothetical protein
MRVQVSISRMAAGALPLASVPSAVGQPGISASAHARPIRHAQNQGRVVVSCRALGGLPWPSPAPALICRERRRAQATQWCRARVASRRDKKTPSSSWPTRHSHGRPCALPGGAAPSCGASSRCNALHPDPYFARRKGVLSRTDSDPERWPRRRGRRAAQTYRK